MKQKLTYILFFFVVMFFSTSAYAISFPSVGFGVGEEDYSGSILIEDNTTEMLEADYESPTGEASDYILIEGYSIPFAVYDNHAYQAGDTVGGYVLAPSGKVGGVDGTSISAPSGYLFAVDGNGVIVPDPAGALGGLPIIYKMPLAEDLGVVFMLMIVGVMYMWRRKQQEA